MVILTCDWLNRFTLLVEILMSVVTIKPSTGSVSDGRSTLSPTLTWHIRTGDGGHGGPSLSVGEQFARFCHR